MTLHHHVLGFMAGSLLLASQGLAGAYVFTIKDFPTANGSCQAHAQAVGDRLTAIAQVKVDRAYCSPGNFGGQDLSVVYEAPRELTAIDSRNHNAIDAGIGQGIYRTAEECQGDLAHQQSEFATMTGSEIVTAYCAKEWFTSSHPYSPMIVAVVTDPEPRPRLMYKTLQVFGRAPRNADAVAQAVSDKLVAAGTAVRKVVLANDAADARLQISYYGTEPLRINLTQNVAFEGEAACQSRAATVTDAYARIGAELYAAFCSADEYSHTTKFYAVEPVSTQGVAWTVVPGVYPSRKACEDDQGHMEDVYRAQGLAVAGSVCGYRKDFQLLILSGR